MALSERYDKVFLYTIKHAPSWWYKTRKGIPRTETSDVDNVYTKFQPCLISFSIASRFWMSWKHEHSWLSPSSQVKTPPQNQPSLYPFLLHEETWTNGRSEYIVHKHHLNIESYKLDRCFDGGVLVEISFAEQITYNLLLSLSIFCYRTSWISVGVGKSNIPWSLRCLMHAGNAILYDEHYSHCLSQNYLVTRVLGADI